MQFQKRAVALTPIPGSSLALAWANTDGSESRAENLSSTPVKFSSLTGFPHFSYTLRTIFRGSLNASMVCKKARENKPRVILGSESVSSSRALLFNTLASINR